MSDKQVIVPQHEIDSIEKSRVHLYELIQSELGDKLNEQEMNHLLFIIQTNVSGTLWRVANRKWPEYNTPTE